VQLKWRPNNQHKLVIVCADKGYYGEPNRTFLAMNSIKDGIMRKNEKNAKLTEHEIERNKKDIQGEVYCGTVFWPESSERRWSKSPVYNHSEKSYRYLAQAGGV